jgi:acyl carrier protein
VAYVVTDKTASFEVESEETRALRRYFIEGIRQYLMFYLPEYMVPSVLVLLDAFPLTVNGKVDIMALPDPDMSLQQSVYIAPTTETEKALCHILQDILNVEQVGMSDTFFELGGHSLLVMKLVAAIESKLSSRLSIRLLFEVHDLQSLAALIDITAINEQGSSTANSVDDTEIEVFEI